MSLDNVDYSVIICHYLLDSLFSFERSTRVQQR